MMMPKDVADPIATLHRFIAKGDVDCAKFIAQALWHDLGSAACKTRCYPSSRANRNRARDQRAQALLSIREIERVKSWDRDAVVAAHDTSSCEWCQKGWKFSPSVFMPQAHV